MEVCPQGMKASIFFFTIIVLLPAFIVNANTVYKYKNEKGEWVFSDKPPETAQAFEQKHYRQDKPSINQPKLSIGLAEDGSQHIQIENPFFAPVEIEIDSPSCASNRDYLIVPARTSVLSCKIDNQADVKKTRFRWAFGDPEAIEDGTVYAIPLGPGLERQITQSFNGRFSHFQEPSKNAVDIAMPIGTDIVAARSGIVTHIKDDYHMGGQTMFFLDKANFIRVLHNDGTFADYAHILMGTAEVEVGEQVCVGQVLARSGTSGFSTGPHLHFVIRKNIGFKYKSVPFLFKDTNNNQFIPRRGMMLRGK